MAPAIDALKRVGATAPILTDYRGSFALVGSSQVPKPSWIMQRQENRYKGPSEIFVKIPLLASGKGLIIMMCIFVAIAEKIN